ncbi:polysaccharide deacetylase family protein, partial [Anaerobaca lacustris]|nr:polysaccharide deacetylase family protein [Sedimentisphaerales bacterium M17dextr]
MEYLAENCNVLSAEGLAYRLTRGEPFPRRSVVLMFDGGYADLLYTAQDVLRRLSLPAVAFVPTAHLLERRPRWYDELEDLLIAHRVTGQCELIVDHDVLRLSLHSSRDRFAAYTRLVSLLSRKSPLHQQDVLQQITRALSPDEGEADSHAVLDAQQLKRMDEGGDMCIGSSTHHHVDPDTLPPWERLQEIARNKEVLEEILGRSIPFFSCPFWAIHDPPFESMALLWKLGFSFAFCNTPGSMTLYTKS